MMSQTLYTRITGADARPEVAEARNGVVHIVALALTKTADGLIDPKLVLSWLLTSLGAPASMIGALVPIREAGALLPQLALARWLAGIARRHRFWAAGSALQGVAALGMAVAAFTLEGVPAGIAILGCLTLLSLARSACSISHKDALARTIPKSRRGALTGAAGSMASMAVLAFGAGLATGLLPLDVMTISLAIAVAGFFWLAGAVFFLKLDEKPKTTVNSDNSGFLAIFRPLHEDPQLRIFIATRALLSVTALASPFLVLLAGTVDGKALGQLGPFILASSAASILSAYLWGRLSDRSTRKTLMAAAVVGSATFAVASWTGQGLGGLMGAVLAIFVSQIAYEGVRAGRKLHLTDMTNDDHRANYTALSNTIMGLVLIAGGGFGVLADLTSPAFVLAVFAVVAGLAVPVAARLDEVQRLD